MSLTGRACAVLLSGLLGCGLAACAAADAPSPDAPPQTVTVSRTTTVPPAGTATPAESPSGTPGELADLVPVNPEAYWGAEPGTLEGYRFRSPSGNIRCQISAIPAACNVAEHAPWPEVDRRYDGIPGATPSAVGWMGEMDLMGRPMTWRQQGTFPAGTGNVLEYGHKITGVRNLDGVDTSVTCGSRETGMTCLIDEGVHGFTVSREGYRAW